MSWNTRLIRLASHWVGRRHTTHSGDVAAVPDRVNSANSISLQQLDSQSYFFGYSMGYTASAIGDCRLIMMEAAVVVLSMAPFAVSAAKPPPRVMASPIPSRVAETPSPLG